MNALRIHEEVERKLQERKKGDKRANRVLTVLFFLTWAVLITACVV